MAAVKLKQQVTDILMNDMSIIKRLNIEKSNFIIFHSYQRHLDRDIIISISGIALKQVESIKHLGILTSG